MEVSAVEQALAAGGPWFRVTRASVVLDIRPGSPTRVLSTLGRPGVLAPRQPPVRVRRSGAVVVADDEPDAAWLNTAYRWWLAGKPAWVDPGWYTAPIRAEVRHLMTLDPGPRLLHALQGLSWNGDGSCPADHSGETGVAGRGVGRPGFPCACLVVTAAAWDTVASWTAHRAAAALVAATGTEPVEIEADRKLGRPTVFDPAREDLAAAVRISPVSAAGRIETARRIAGLPTLTGLIRAGFVTHLTGKLIAAELVNLRPAAAAAVLAVVADRLRQRAAAGLRPWGWPDLRDLIAQLKARLAPEEVVAARRRAQADRRVNLYPQPDGMTTLAATIADVDAHRIYRRLSAIAAGLDGDDDPRSTDQQRADILVDLLTATASRGGGDTSLGGRAGGGPSDPAVAGGPGDPDSSAGDAAQGCGCSGDAVINVVITLPALLGLTDDPARIDGIGPVPAEVARQLAADGGWRAWLLDAEQALVTATGSLQYRPGAALARLVRAREPRCRMPGCRRSATRSDLDHTIEYPHGPTAAWNLGPLCRRHHVEKTHGDYDLHGPPDQTTADTDGITWTWTTPSGIRITDHPEPPLE